MQSFGRQQPTCWASTGFRALQHSKETGLAVAAFPQNLYLIGRLLQGNNVGRKKVMVCPRAIEQKCLVVSGDTTDTILQLPCWLLGSKQDLISAAKCFVLLLCRSVKGSRNSSHSVRLCWMLAFLRDSALPFGEVF